MTGPDKLVAAILGPRSMGQEVTGYNGQLRSIAAGQDDNGVTTGLSATVVIGADTWIVTNLSGPFLNEIATAGPNSLIGRTVRVYMTNGQPEIAYTVDPSTTITGPAAAAAAAVVADPTVGVWRTLTQTNQNVNGLLGCTLYWAWYINTAYECELRFLFRTPGITVFPTAYQYLTVPFPIGTVPASPAIPLISTGKHGIAVMNDITVAVRLDPGGYFYVFQANNPSNAGFVEGSMSFQLNPP